MIESTYITITRSMAALPAKKTLLKSQGEVSLEVEK